MNLQNIEPFKNINSAIAENTAEIMQAD